MSLYPIKQDDFEYFTIISHPKREFISSSYGGVTGTISINSLKSDSEKDSRENSKYLNNYFEEDGTYNFIIKNPSGTNMYPSVAGYIDFVHNSRQSAKNRKLFSIKRFEPSIFITDDTFKKNYIKNVLLKQNREVYPNYNWAYTNYNSLNFFTSSMVSTSTVIMYPNSSSNSGGSFVSGVYTIPSGWSFDFYINPKYSNGAGSNFHAGTLFHLSSSYCVSLISGSSRDINGLVNGYRIQLQLSHSANISPSLASTGVFPNNLIFLSPDNSLKKNNWHHVCIRWGTNSINNGTGSFFIDGTEVSTFNIPSSTIMPRIFLGGGNPDVLCVGNYYEGNNIGDSLQNIFFDRDVATNDGLVRLNTTSTNGNPASYRFAHPLNAEVHDLKIFNKFKTKEEILENTKYGAKTLNNLIFYCPPFFTKESPTRNVLLTPFYSSSKTTTTPFNVDMSFSVYGLYVNLENFGRDFSTKFYPRWFNLTSSLNQNLVNLSASQLLYATASLRKRNLTLLPCDNGKFYPNFELLKSGSNVLFSGGENSNHSMYVDDLNTVNFGYISLNELISTSSIDKTITDESGTLFNEIVGPTPERTNRSIKFVPSMLQRLRDPSSNEVSFFNISNLFFGSKINPGSFKLTDSYFTGSGDKVSITLRDDKYGNLYRADSLTEHAKWSSVGNIFYNEGIIAIKSPHISKIGKDQFTMNFEGEQPIFVTKIRTEASINMVNSSSHPNFIPLSSSLLANEIDNDFVYITNMYFFDENLNVLMKTNFSQPIKKKNGDKVSIIVGTDY